MSEIWPMFRNRFRNMFRAGSLTRGVKTVLLAGALLTVPRPMVAQHGGAAPGGAGSSPSGLSGPAGRATGVATKDELKDYRAVLAVQATSQQIIAYNLMVKSAEAASAESRTFQHQLGKGGVASEISSRAALEQSLEKARAENKKFLDELSETQKTGLKEIIKRLAKADSELEQQARALDQTAADSKAVVQQVAAAAENLDHALTSFRAQQADLGEEMSIGAANSGQDSSFNILPVKNSITFAHQAIAITTSGVISEGSVAGGENTFKLELTTDLTDLQLNITEVLRAKLNKADRCGEQITIQNATLTPLAPASLATVQLHFERWVCLGGTINEMAEGNGTIEVKLTPTVGEDGSLQLAPEIRRIDAEGLVGELLRSGSLGDAVRDAVTQSILSTVSQGEDFKVTLPATAQGCATLRHAEFQGTGAGKLMAVLNGEIRVPNEKATQLTSELKKRSSPQQEKAQ